MSISYCHQGSLYVFFSLSETKVAIFLSRDMAGASKGPGGPGGFRNPLMMLPPAEAEEVCPSAFCPQLALNLLGDTVQLSVMHTQIHTRVHTLTHKPTSCRASNRRRQNACHCVTGFVSIPSKPRPRPVTPWATASLRTWGSCQVDSP